MHYQMINKLVDNLIAAETREIKKNDPYDLANYYIAITAPCTTGTYIL